MMVETRCLALVLSPKKAILYDGGASSIFVAYDCAATLS